MSVAFPKVFKCEDHIYNNLLLPAGTYSVVIKDSNKLTTKEGTAFCQLDLLINSEGEYKGQVKPLNIWLWSGSEKSIAYNASLLGKVGLACGVKEFSDTRLLHDKPFSITFDLDEYDGNKRNNVIACDKITNQNGVKPPQPSQPVSQPEPVEELDADVPW